MPELSLFRPGAILDLGDKHRPRENSTPAAERPGRRIHHDRIEQLAQLDRFLLGPARPASADIDEPLAVPRRQQ